MKKIEGSPSQAMQDSFVMNMLNWKTNGFYLEIGACEPILISNTYSLETMYGWSGVSLEINSALIEPFNSIRRNKCYEADATQLDYAKFLSEVGAPQRIDYLQLDIEPAPNTYKALCSIPFDLYRFSVITFEHDLYSDPNNDNIRVLSRQLLADCGYQLVVGNVKAAGLPYEDWYVDPTHVDSSVWQTAVNSDVNFTEMFE